jgi:hypothetical protein
MFLILYYIAWMSKEFEEKVNNDIRMMKRELIEIKELVKMIHSDLNKLLGKNHLSRSNSYANFETLRNEKHTDLVQESPKLLRKKSWRLSSPRAVAPDVVHSRRRATEGNITTTKSSF